MKQPFRASAPEEVTAKIDVRPFISHSEKMRRLEVLLQNAMQAADFAGEHVRKCRGHLAQAVTAFEALKE